MPWNKCMPNSLCSDWSTVEGHSGCPQSGVRMRRSPPCPGNHVRISCRLKWGPLALVLKATGATENSQAVEIPGSVHIGKLTLAPVKEARNLELHMRDKEALPSKSGS